MRPLMLLNITNLTALCMVIMSRAKSTKRGCAAKKKDYLVTHLFTRRSPLPAESSASSSFQYLFHFRTASGRLKSISVRIVARCSFHLCSASSL